MLPGGRRPAAVTRTLPGHKCNVRCLDFTSDNLVSGSNDCNVKVGTCCAPGSLPLTISPVATLHLRLPGASHPSFRQLGSIARAFVLAVALSRLALSFADAHAVAGAVRAPARSQLWDLRMRNAVVTCKGHGAPVLHAKLSPDNKWVASGDQEGQVKVRRRRHCRRRCHSIAHFISVPSHAAAVSTGVGARAGDLGNVERTLRDAKGGGVGSVRRCRPRKQYAGARGLPPLPALAPGAQSSARVLLCAAQIFDLVAGRVIHEYGQHTHPITGLEFHPTEYLLATASADKTVKVRRPPCSLRRRRRAVVLAARCRPWRGGTLPPQGGDVAARRGGATCAQRARRVRACQG